MVMEQKIENEGSQVADSIHSVVSNSWGDYRSPLSVINGSSVIHLPDVPEDRPWDELCKKNLRTIKGDIFNSCVSQKDEENIVVGATHKDEKASILDQPVAFLLSALSETGLVSLLSLLTAVLLQANNRSSSEQASFILPSNFEDVATGVLKVLNNVAHLDLVFLQQMLARPDLKMEIVHLMSFLLSHCTSKFKASNDQVGILMLESLSLLGHLALFHPSNQAVLQWGKSPTILHKVSEYLKSDPELMPFLAATLIAACYGCEQNKFVVQQELNVDMLLSLLRSCKNASSASQFNSTSDSSPADESNEQNQVGSECRKPHVDVPVKYNRTNGKGTRNSLGKSGTLGNGTKTRKMRSQKDSKAIKNTEEVAPKQNLYLPEASSLMLHCRFPNSFVDKAEQFFSAEIPNGIDKVQTL